MRLHYSLSFIVICTMHLGMYAQEAPAERSLKNEPTILHKIRLFLKAAKNKLQNSPINSPIAASLGMALAVGGVVRSQFNRVGERFNNRAIERFAEIERVEVVSERASPADFASSITEINGDVLKSCRSARDPRDPWSMGVAKIQNKVIGVVTFGTNCNNSNASYIRMLAVDEDYRGRGVGKKLVDYACKKLFEINGPTTVSMQLLEPNARVKRFFTEHCEFEPSCFFQNRFFKIMP